RVGRQRGRPARPRQAGQEGGARHGPAHGIRENGHRRRPGLKMGTSSPESLSQAPERITPSGRPAKRMTLYALGINHQTAPVALREQVAFGESAVPAALAELRSLPGVREVALL